MHDFIHVLFVVEEEKGVDVHRERSNLRAFTMMRNLCLWLNHDKKIISEIPGIHIGDAFVYRIKLVVVCLYGLPQNYPSCGKPCKPTTINFHSINKHIPNTNTDNHANDSLITI
jgi:hypothetical protein